MSSHKESRHFGDRIHFAAGYVADGQSSPAQEGLNALLEGNLRFAAGQPQNPHQDDARRKEVLGGQTPFAVILTCSDSRVPPEIIFDQGVGDLFVVRTAGNVVDDIALGSIEYAVEHLNAPLIVVLGHQKCGAVSAAVQGGEIPGHIADIVREIEPAIAAARDLPGDLADNTVKTNVAQMVEKLKTSAPILKEFFEADKIQVVGMRYELTTGKVSQL